MKKNIISLLHVTLFLTLIGITTNNQAGAPQMGYRTMNQIHKDMADIIQDILLARENNKPVQTKNIILRNLQNEELQKLAFLEENGLETMAQVSALMGELLRNRLDCGGNQKDEFIRQKEWMKAKRFINSQADLEADAPREAKKNLHGENGSLNQAFAENSFGLYDMYDEDSDDSDDEDND